MGAVGFLWGHTIDTGVILPNDDKDLYARYPLVIQITDFDIGDQGVQTDVFSNIKPIQQIKIARFGREFGKIAPQSSGDNYGDIDVVSVTAGSGDPYKRTGGSDVVGRVYPVTHAGSLFQPPTASRMLCPTVFEIAFWPEDTSEITIRAYVQSVGARTDPTDIFMEVDYISQYYSTTVYRTDTIYSDETISARSDASDWSQYVEVTITPATTAEPIIVRVRAIFYDATGTNYAYVDPAITVN
jgi:hypothetical protein